MKFEKIKKMIVPFLCVAFIIIISFLFYKDLVTKQLVSTKIKVIFVSISLILTLILLFIGRYVYKHKEIRPEKFFLIFGTIVGCIYLIATPILKAHDEMYHWYKSYAISMLHFLPETESEGLIYDRLPESVQNLSYDTGVFYERNYVKTIKTFLKIELKDAIFKEPSEQILIENTPTAYYPFIQMLPQAIGIGISRMFGLNIMLQAYAGRFGNLIFFLFAGYFAIKLLPNRKYILLILLLSPKVLYISTSLSGDVFTNGVCILFISYILNLIHTKKILKKLDYLAIFSLLICVSISKIVYIPLCFLIFLVPKECFNFKNINDISKQKKNKIIITLILVVLAILIGLVWLKISTGYLGSSQPNSKLQVMYVLKHPFEYCATLLRSLSLNIVKWSLDLVGGYMQWGGMFELYPVISLAVYVLMFFAFFLDKDDFKLSNGNKLLFSLVFIAIVVLVLTSLYVQWNTRDEDGIGATTVSGIQGRYFTPIFMLVPFVLSNNLLELKKKIDRKVIYYGILGFTLPALLSILVVNII